MLTKIFNAIDGVSEKICRIVSLLAIILTLNVCIGVFFRYFLNESYLWGYVLNQQIFGVFVLFAGVYAMITGKHLRVDILFSRFPQKMQRILGIVYLAFLLVFMVILIWKSAGLALFSISIKELTPGTPKIPLYFFKAMIPLVSSLLLLVGISHIYKTYIKQNKPELSKESEETIKI